MSLRENDKLRRRYSSKGLALQITTNDNSDIADKNFNIYVGTGGHIKVDTEGGNTITLKNVPSGTYINWIEVKKIYRTGTTARDIVAIYE